MAVRIYDNPPREQWGEIVARPKVDLADLSRTVAEVLEAVRVEGDELLDNVAEILHHARLAAPALDVALDGGGDDAVVLDDEYAVVHRPILRISR